MNKPVTVEEFIDLIAADFPDGSEIRNVLMLEIVDLCDKNDILIKKTAARILHAYLAKFTKEKDTDDIGKASVLRDLFDCRVCVNHIAQMYLKGIMEGFVFPSLSDNNETMLIFDSNREVCEEEAKIFVKRLLFPEFRVVN